MVLGGMRFAGLAGGCTSSAWNAPDTTGRASLLHFPLVHRRWIAGGHYARLKSWARRITAVDTSKTVDCVVTREKSAFPAKIGPFSVQPSARDRRMVAVAASAGKKVSIAISSKVTSRGEPKTVAA